MQLNIIILTYNCLNKIKECLNSIYEHTKQEFNIFIVENNSQDGTREYVQKITEEKNNIYLSLQKENLGIIKGRNRGYDFSTEIKKSDLTIFLDADQIVLSGWLESYLKLIIDEHYDLVGCESWKMREKDFLPYKKITDKKEKISYLGAGGMMMKSSLFEQLGKFDESYDFIYFEDSSLCFKAYYQGYKIGWNYNNIIHHNHTGPLLNPKNKKYFLKNWKTFQLKWKNYKVPIIKTIS